jgi:hypothetical protein
LKQVNESYDEHSKREAATGGEGINPGIKRQLELQIKILPNAPRDAEKLERLLKAKERQKEEDIDIESYTQRSKNAVVPS